MTVEVTLRVCATKKLKMYILNNYIYIVEYVVLLFGSCVIKKVKINISIDRIRVISSKALVAHSSVFFSMCSSRLLFR